MVRVDLPAQRLDLRHDGAKRLLRRVGVDVGPVGALLAVTLDAPPQEVHALVDVGDQGLLLRQDQPHRGQHLRGLLSQGQRILPGARDQQRPIVGEPHEAVVRQAIATPLGPAPGRGCRTARCLGEVFVQPGQGHVAEQRGQDRSLWSTGVGVLQQGVLGEDACLQECLHQRQDALVTDASTHPV